MSVARAWTRLAAWTGGTVGALATATAADGGPLVFAATAIGLHCSADGGQSWAPIGVGRIASLVDAVAPSPHHASDRTIYAGTEDGLYRSPDGGESWQRVLTGGRVLALTLAPLEQGQYVALVGTEADGILRSDDGGATWTGANPGLLDLTVLAVALSPHFAEDQTGFAGTASGLYRTRSGGRAWRPLELPVDEAAVQCLAVSPSFADDRLVLAGTEADGLLRSDDGGGNWKVVPDLAQVGVTAVAFSTFYPERRIIAAATGAGMAVSRDGGETWQIADMDMAWGPVLSLAFARQGDREALLAGLSKRGVARSVDAGRTWAAASEGMHAIIPTAIALSPHFALDQTLFVASLQDGVAVSRDGGSTWTAGNVGLDDAPVFGLAVSPGYAHDRTLFAATAAGLYRSRDGAVTWRPVASSTRPVRAVVTGGEREDGPTPLFATVQGGQLLRSTDGETWSAVGRPFGGAGATSLARAPGDATDRTVFVATRATEIDDHAAELVLWHSGDGGERWDRWLEERGRHALTVAVSPGYATDRTLFVGSGNLVVRLVGSVPDGRRDACRPAARRVPLADRSAVVTALALSPAYLADATLFAASSAGVDVSRDGGETFQRWSDGLSPGAVSAIALSPHYPTDRLVYALGLGGALWQRIDE